MAANCVYDRLMGSMILIAQLSTILMQYELACMVHVQKKARAGGMPCELVLARKALLSFQHGPARSASILLC